MNTIIIAESQALQNMVAE